MVQRETTNDNELQRMTTSGTASGTTNDNEWYNQWQRMTTSDNELQGMATSGTTNDTTSDNKWQQVTTSDHFG